MSETGTTESGLPFEPLYGPDALEGFDPAEQQTLVDYLGRVLGNLKVHSASETGSASGAQNAAEPGGNEPSSSTRAKRPGRPRPSKAARR